ncbi:MAG: AbrB/MazE/SpoVT family DNA-binding domain-containing protein [bacterium]|nr:AbrB/MazE/SpoVT family DNA-binding domain-containing protein [bacterium]
MRLQKQLSKKIGDKEYAKYVIVIPPKTIEKLGWKTGQELKAKLEKGKLIIEKE